MPNVNLKKAFVMATLFILFIDHAHTAYLYRFAGIFEHWVSFIALGKAALAGVALVLVDLAIKD